jgi:2-polyprenyl-6-methoxyphenol hydroxylase-like FAD-dependent oxidoreductase
VGADGRHSTVRERAGLVVDDLGAPIDVLWMRLSRQSSDSDTFMRIGIRKALVMLDRGDYWQCAFVIPKGGAEEMRQRGLQAFRADIVELAPLLKERVTELQSWDDIKLLSVKVDRLREWYRPGLLCIGDAAHAMSPIGGVGVNLAVQDAVAAANILALPLREGRLTTDDLAAVQRRRTLPMKVIQAMQIGVQSRVIDPLLDSEKPITAPWAATLFNRFPVLRRIPARIIGIGVRPEHVHSPQLNKPVGAVAQS